MEKMIYIADDEELIRDVYNESLKNFYNIQLFEDGSDLIDAYDNKKPDLVITDYKMKTDGIKVVKHIRHENKDTETPIIMTTGTADYDSRYLADITPKFNLLEKPIGLSDLRNTVSELLNE